MLDDVRTGDLMLEKTGASALLDQEVLPVGGNPSGGAGHGLVDGMMVGRCEARPFQVFVGSVVPEPILARLEAGDDGVTGGVRMRRRVLAGRVVAASDVAALRTPSEVKPPTPDSRHSTQPVPLGGIPGSKEVVTFAPPAARRSTNASSIRLADVQGGRRLEYFPAPFGGTVGAIQDERSTNAD